jgi:hypothetical protein
LKKAWQKLPWRILRKKECRAKKNGVSLF